MDPGEAVGMSALAGEPHTATVVAGTEAEVALLPISSLHRLFAREPALALGVVSHLAHLVGLLTDEKVDQRDEPLNARVLTWLRQRAPSGGRVLIAHAELARHVGATRARVSSSLERLERRGLVRLGRGRIEVLDGPRAPRERSTIPC
jgi:CRP/FNR family transcriptional regulator